MINVDYVSQVKQIINNHMNIQDSKSLQVNRLEKTNIFDNFYKEILIFFELSLRDILLELNNKQFNIDVDKVVLNCLVSFRMDMIDLCKKVLISELYKMKENNQLMGEDKFSRYEYFEDLLTGEKRMKIIEENPVLAFLILNKSETKISHLRECLEKLVNDFEEIKEKFSLNINVLNKISLDEGDTHNGGKSVIILEFRGDKRVVYKPHSMDADESFGRFLEYINAANYLRYDLKLSRVINKDTYGWQEFVTYVECENEEQIKAHFYRIGAFIAIFNIIKSKDFHYENLIAHGQYPVPIDLETVLSNRKVQLGESESFYSLAEAYAREIDQSIYGTLMIPQNLEMLRFDVDMSGLNGGIGSTEDIEFSRILNVGTDEIGYERVKGSIDEKQNRVRFQGKLVELQDYVPEIVMGLDEGYEFFISNKEEIMNLIGDNEIFSGKYRQVLRATAKYVKFIDAAIHPVYTDKFESRVKVFSYLFGKNKLNEETKCRIESEINQLYKNDVPYFWADFNSRDLYGADGTCLPNYFEKTMRELVLERIGLINKKDKEKQILYIKGSIASLVNIQDSHNFKQRYVSRAFDNASLKDISDNKFIELAIKIAEHIEDICIWNSAKSKCSFMALNVQLEGTIKYGSLNRNLYEGAGVILFFATLAKETGNDNYKNIAYSIIEGYEEIYNKPEFEMTSPGAFTGIGSLLYIYYNLWQLFNDRFFYDKYRQCVQNLLDLSFSNKQIDVIDGTAGLSIILSNIYSKENDTIVLQLMQKCGESLYSELSKSYDNYLTGFSHGYAGFSAALFALSHHLKNDEYYDLAKALVVKENQHIDFEKGNWMDLRHENKESDPVYWCHGASGIALSRSISKRFLKDVDINMVDKDIERGVKKTLVEGFNDDINHSLCHGSLGNIDCLLSIAKTSNDHMLMKEVYEITNKICNNMVATGIECANPLKVETVNFMLGISGIGYELIRLHNSSLPSVLALEVL
ncbi:type 2 lantipeptide synthetase LanM family protein [Clostridium sp. YIM B02505]|uniref:Type 2 lantipeptide synthetase LanM family protein n=1 Tax=Clostridium yunnanense TaxID=2800325 RepID=A0ABS1EWP9_9CLOT|nr:type 2 lanthipeptide synthetase LanM family protein [Clostridium yunnanense]MBK1813749.1 type 2 lantipeptide synthetase LanM family protein [Clostridium yunnanense]